MKRKLIPYLIYTTILVVSVIWILNYCHKSLILYEASQPEKIFEAESFCLPDITSQVDDVYKDYLNNCLAGELSYRYLKENYTDGSLVYEIYSNDTHFADINLIPVSSYNRMILLNITDWQLGDITPVLPDISPYDCVVTVPEGYKVYINDNLLDDSYITETKENDKLTYCNRYVEVPKIYTYTMPDIISNTNIKVTDMDGNIIHEEENSFGLTDRPSVINCDIDYADSVLPDDIKNMALSNAIRYASFFSMDLPGAAESIDPIRDLFPADSDYLTLADQFRRTDMQWIYASLSKTTTENELVDNYIIYNDNCFSIHVSFDKNGLLYGQQKINDKIDDVYYYVKINGSWKIADIR